jgi:hypothetical protein
MLDEVLVVLHQDLLDILGVAQEKRGPSTESKMNNITILTRAIFQEAKNVAPNVQEAAKDGKSARTGWRSLHCGSGSQHLTR